LGAGGFPSFRQVGLTFDKVVGGEVGSVDNSHCMCLRMLCLGLATLTDVHLLADEAHKSGPLERRHVANGASDAVVLHKRLGLYFLLLDGDRDLLFDLRLDHLDQKFLVLGVDTACAFTTATGVRPSLLSLPAIAPEAGNGLRLLSLVHQLLVLLGQIQDLLPVILYFSGLLGD